MAEYKNVYASPEGKPYNGCGQYKSRFLAKCASRMALHYAMRGTRLLGTYPVEVAA